MYWGYQQRSSAWLKFMEAMNNLSATAVPPRICMEAHTHIDHGVTWLQRLQQLHDLRAHLLEQQRNVELLLPYATIEPIRNVLLQMFMGEKFGRDSIWESHLATELWATKVPLEAVLDEQQLTLRDVMQFEAGQTLMLNNGPDGTIDLRCGGVPLGKGRMGRVGNHVPVRVEQGIRQAKRAAIAQQIVPDIKPSGAGK